MNAMFIKLQKALRRPLPDLFFYILSKIISFLWKKNFKCIGSNFHVEYDALLQGCKFITIGDNFYFGRQLWIEAVQEYAGVHYEPQIIIGNNVQGSQSVHIAANYRVIIGNNVLFGSRIHITDHGHGTYKGENHDSPSLAPSKRSLAFGRAVTICSNVWLCDGVVVLPGVTIGEGCIVGANSVVTKDLPPFIMAAGAPAKPIKKFNVDSSRWDPIEAVVDL